MRSPQEQDDFLNHGRFDEGNPSLIRTAVIIGLVLIALGFALAGFSYLAGIGRDDGGPFFLMGFVLSVSIGLLFCLWGLVLKLTSKR
jgi:hypothetical protein